MIVDFSDLPIPPLRQDLEAIALENDGARLVLLRDPSGYAEEMMQLSPEAWLLTTLFDGSRNASALHEGLVREGGIRVAKEQIRAFADALERNSFLDSRSFRDLRERLDAEYAALPVRTAAFAGASYPDDGDEARAFLASLFDADETPVPDAAPIGVIAPHIDLQIGPDVYVPAFRSLAKASFDTVVVLGTSHYSSEDLFILTEKDFETPLGTLRNDAEFVRTLKEHTGHRFTARDTAFRMEHAIEFPVLFLQHMFGNERIRIVPVLCTSFEHFFAMGADVRQDDRYAAFIDGFRATLEQLDRRAVFVLSVDWSHVGRKFGDDTPAAEILPDVRVSDLAQLEALAAADYVRFSAMLQETMNATRIDGFSCITTFFDLVRPAHAALLKYDQWHEEERESGVTYASMAFYR